MFLFLLFFFSQPVCHGTVIPFPNFNPLDDAGILRKAMKGAGMCVHNSEVNGEVIPLYLCTHSLWLSIVIAFIYAYPLTISSSLGNHCYSTLHCHYLFLRNGWKGNHCSLISPHISPATRNCDNVQGRGGISTVVGQLINIMEERAHTINIMIKCYFSFCRHHMEKIWLRI